MREPCPEHDRRRQQELELRQLQQMQQQLEGQQHFMQLRIQQLHTELQGLKTLPPAAVPQRQSQERQSPCSHQWAEESGCGSAAWSWEEFPVSSSSSGAELYRTQDSHRPCEATVLAEGVASGLLYGGGDFARSGAACNWSSGYDASPWFDTAWTNHDGARTPGCQSTVATLRGQTHPKRLSVSTRNSQMKIFVGGVPQGMSQDDLYKVFSVFAGVKRAWLQKHRTSGTNGHPRNHRGFGFVIFHDSRAVDGLLGDNDSRFIALGSGGKLEIKRAVSSSEMQGTNSKVLPWLCLEPEPRWPGLAPAVERPQPRRWPAAEAPRPVAGPALPGASPAAAAALPEPPWIDGEGPPRRFAEGAAAPAAAAAEARVQPPLTRLACGVDH
mmetsp:Transcript_58472/g.161816  ORF Transcript_58472/g.161816 Transcript_58472/m.161816 type:complete len:384 (+) Transcript_58472:131-1282(+)|eukprot:CAMPEP_0179118452 /NCGR_PEP_ID=MMETSP0796-20121207/55706_1 /TAXON_ID=73915 /ORGANISM="Pyrodinium bahamense, Strain pbaha01" /LENGTH=383 /DNA_ID=CAMNT_0020816901 /DNA_START=131 /DNA_END=1282 /DNA_ORIENTATION=+